MGRALSLDLRERVIAAVEGGMSCRAAAARFGVGVSSAIRWRQQHLARGHVKPGRPGGDVRSSAVESQRAFLLSLVEEQPDLTLLEIREALAGRGIQASVAAVWRFFDRHGITRKKSRSTHPSRIGQTY
jgi:transposase